MKLKIININLCLLIALFFGACSANKELMSSNPPYDVILEYNTKSGKAYSDFETTLIASATYKDMKFVTAQVNKKGKELLYSNEKIDDLLKSAKKNDELDISFFVGVYTPDSRVADFSKEKGLWKFYLKKDGGKPIEAYQVKEVAKDKKAECEELYPYLSNWMQGYEVSFIRSGDKNELARPFSLLITGATGTLELTFE